MKKVGLSLLALAISTALVGCGGGDDSSSISGTNENPQKTSPETYTPSSTGTFTDSNVAGLYYVSGDVTPDYTSDDGTYNIDQSAKTITFYLGENGFKIGSISARDVSTPFEAAGTYERAVNLARLLLTIDTDGDTSADTTITIPPVLQTDVSSVDGLTKALHKISLEDDKFETSVADLLTELNITSGLVDEADAISHMQNSLSGITRGDNTTLEGWSKGDGQIFVSRTATRRIRETVNGDYKIVINTEATLGKDVLDATAGLSPQYYQLNSDSFETLAGSNDSTISSSYADEYLTCVVNQGTFGWETDSNNNKTPSCTEEKGNEIISIPTDTYTYVLTDPTGEKAESTDWSEVAKKGRAYECMNNSNCSEATLNQFQVNTDIDDSDNNDGSELQDETISGSYDPVTGVYTKVRTKEITKSSESSNVGRKTEYIEFLYQVDSIGEDKYVDFTGTWEAITTTPNCGAIESKWVFDGDGVTVTGSELTNTTTCATTDYNSKTVDYDELASMDYWWFKTNGSGNDSKATLDQLNTTIRWNDYNEDTDTDYYKINRFSYIPAGADWDQGTLVRDTLNDSGDKIATVTMRKTSD